MAARVLLLDDHPAVLRQVSQLLSGEFDVVAALEDGAGLAAAIEAHRPDVAVLDITLPGTTGLELASQLQRTSGPPRIVFLTVHGDSDYVRAAFAAGASGYVVKSRLATDLIPALRAALEGRRFVSPGSECPEAGN